MGFVEDEVLDQVGLWGGVLWNPHLRGEMLTPASKLSGDPEMWGTRGGAGFAGQEEGDDAKVGDEAAGVVVEAEVLPAEGGRAAAVSVGEDVAAEDGERTVRAIQAAEGKRLMYKSAVAPHA